MMEEAKNWAKYSYYQDRFKEKGFILKLEFKRRKYKGVMNRMNDFTIYIDGEYKMNYHFITFDIIDCILLSMIIAIELMEKK